MATLRRPWETAGFWTVVAMMLIATGMWIHESSHGGVQLPQSGTAVWTGSATTVEVDPGPTPRGAAVYHGNTRTHKFHRSTCSYFDCPNCTAKFTTCKDAIAAGYHACGTCKP
jgi:hypothetical protein